MLVEYPLSLFPSKPLECAASVISYALVAYPILVVCDIPSEYPFMSFSKATAGMDLPELWQDSTFVFGPHQIDRRQVHVALGVLPYGIDAMIFSHD